MHKKLFHDLHRFNHLLRTFPRMMLNWCLLPPPHAYHQTNSSRRYEVRPAMPPPTARETSAEGRHQTHHIPSSRWQEGVNYLKINVKYKTLKKRSYSSTNEREAFNQNDSKHCCYFFLMKQLD